MQSINVKLEAFEGPFDLLFHLIEKNEIDIYDIPIATLTDQYLEYLDQASQRNMDGMSEFLVMAATLLEIKSKMLLPAVKKEEEKEDPREELVSKLLEYKKFKEVTESLKNREEEAALIFYKAADAAMIKLKQEKEPQDLDSFLQGVTLDDLYRAFEDVMRRKEVKVDKVRSSFRYVERDLFTVQEKMEYIRDLLILSPKTTFSSIFRENAKKMEVVVTFLALLELIKLKQVQIMQSEIFEEIVITKYDGVEE